MAILLPPTATDVERAARPSSLGRFVWVELTCSTSVEKLSRAGILWIGRQTTKPRPMDSVDGERSTFEGTLGERWSFSTPCGSGGSGYAAGTSGREL